MTTTSMTPVTFTSNHLTAAIADVQRRVKTARQQVCVDEAKSWFAQFYGVSSWTLKTSFICIKSRHSGRMYRLDLDTLQCNCPSVVKCWHIAVAVVILKAVELATADEAEECETTFDAEQEAAERERAVYDEAARLEIDAECEELFA